MAEALIYDSLRTPRGSGRASGSLHTLSPIDLGATVLTALAERTGCTSTTIDDVVFGCGDAVDDQGADIARSSLLRAGFDEKIPGSVVSRFCSSGLDAANSAAARVMAGQADCMIAGGVEMMSLISMGGTGGPWGSDAEFNTITNFTPLGVAADLVATLDGHSREDVDAYAVESQKRAARAWNEGRFKGSVVAVNDFNGTPCLSQDEHMRPSTDMAALAKAEARIRGHGYEAGFGDIVRQRYPQVNRLNHVHTAGNSSGVVDGAAAMLIGSAALGKELDRRPRARFVSFATVGCDPCLMLDGARRSCAQMRCSRRADPRRRRSVRGQRSVCFRRACISWRRPEFRTTGSTSMAAPSPWAIRSAPPAIS